MEVKKPSNFEKIMTFGRPWKELCFGSAIDFDFGSILRCLGAKFLGFWLQKDAKSENFPENLHAKLGLLQASSNMTF